MTVPSWLPDWRDPEQYPYYGDTTPKQWAWEFLRRNPEYQKAYSDAASIPTDRSIKLIDGLVPSYFRDDPLYIAAETFGLFYLANPSEDYENIKIYFTWRCYVEIDGLDPGVQKIDNKALRDQIFIYDFNLNLPIEEQLQKAKELFLFVQEGRKGSKYRAPAYDYSHFRNYLRIFDAKTEGIKGSEIADIIFPDIPTRKDRVKSGYKSAKKLSSRNWKFLML